MKIYQRFFLVSFLMAVFLAVACSSSSTTTASTTPTGQATVTGTLYQPNGTDPLPGALLYISTSSSSSLVKALTTPSTRPGNFGNFLTVGTDCDDVPSGTTAAGSTCTDADGTFLLSLSDCSLFTLTDTLVTINYKKGSTISGTFTTTLTCSGSSTTPTTNTVAADDSTIAGDSANLKIAICSGAWDQMENVLARMGFAPSDTDEDGTDDLNGWDGTVTENFNYFRGETGADEDFPSCCELLKGEDVAITDQDGNAVVDSAGAAITRSMSDYDILFLNCGSGCELGGFTTVIEDVLTNADSQTAIQNFVSDGGAFYVTDLSYDFIEQNFPGEVDFAGGGSGTSAETEQAAQVGTSGSGVFEPLSATVNEDTLKNYLSSVTAGNTDCATPTGTGALNSDESVFLCDFLSSWAVMIGLETGNSTTDWIQGAPSYSGGPYTNAAGATVTSGSTDIPLTVGFAEGDGAVLYTSYHTDNSSTLTTEFLPQERVLQFLILDLLGQI